MSKKVRTIILSVVGLAILVAATILLLTLPEKEDETTTSSVDYMEGTEYLVQETDATITKLVVKNSLDEFTIESIGEKAWGIKELGDFDKVSAYDSIISNISTILASSVVTEDASDLKTYGLDSPSLTLDITFSNGKNYKVKVGDMPDYATAYTMVEGNNKIYQVPKSKYDALMVNKLSFLDKIVIPAATVDKEGQPVPTDVTYMEITRPDLEKPIIFEKYSQEELDSGKVVSAGVRMVSPAVSDLRGEASQRYIYSYLGLTASEVIAINPTTEQLTEYGFDEPTSTITFDYNETSHVKITTGKTLEVEGVKSYYVMREGVEEIFLVPAESMLWLTLQPKDIISPIALIPPIVNLDTVDITFDGKKYTLEYLFGEDRTDSNEMKANVDGETVNIDDAKKFLQILYYSEVKDFLDEKPTKTPDLSVVYHLHKGGTQTLDLYEREDRQTVVVVNSENIFIGRVGYIEKIKKEFNNLLNGEPVITDR